MKITKAMKLVAAAKLRRAQEQVMAARPYAAEMAKVLSRLAAAQSGDAHPLMTERPSRRVAYVVITADRGLAGPYNNNIIRKAHDTIRREEREVTLICIGRKGRDYFRRRGITPAKEWVGLGEEARLSVARTVVQELVNLFTGDQVDEVRVIYAQFISALTQRATDMQLLPIAAPAAEEESEEADVGPQMDYLYEPTAEQVLAAMVPRYVETLFFQSMLEAKASEHGARMTAMGAATDNAKELFDKLSLAYNRARQAGITREIADIVGGAEALEA